VFGFARLPEDAATGSSMTNCLHRNHDHPASLIAES
jgi:hypothetical protein